MSEDMLDVSEAIDSAPVGGAQVRVFVLCALVAMFDGFDTQSIAFVAPVIAEDWGIDSTSFGPIFSAGLVGLMIGQLMLSVLSDRFGRKVTIIASTAIFGIFTLATAFADNWSTLLSLRFLAGFGLGGAIPNVMAMTSEFAPRRIRAMLIAIVFAGFPMGAVIGGYLSIHLIAALGWQSVFAFGGLAPLALVFVLLAMLPESPRLLIRFGREDAARKVMSGIVPGGLAQSTRLVATEPDVGRASPLTLVRDDRRAQSLLLWAIFFMSLLVIYFLMSWLPLIIKERGLSLDLAITAAVTLNIGGGIGGVVLGRLIDRANPFLVLSASFMAGSAAIAAIGMTGSSAAQILTVAFAAGFCMIGTQTGLCAFTASLYPTALRSTGLGTALAVGRLGSIIGPMAGGALLASGLPVSQVFAAVAIPPVIAMVAVLVLGRFTRSHPYGDGSLG